MLWKNNLIEAIQAKKKTSVDIVTDEFPLDCYEHSELTFFFEPTENNMRKVHAIFQHHFFAEDAEKVLHKQSILKRAFEKLQSPCTIEAELGTESFEEGCLVMRLRPEEFSMDYEESALAYCARFVETVVLIHAVESYEE